MSSMSRHPSHFAESTHAAEVSVLRGDVFTPAHAAVQRGHYCKYAVVQSRRLRSKRYAAVSGCQLQKGSSSGCNHPEVERIWSIFRIYQGSSKDHILSTSRWLYVSPVLVCNKIFSSMHRYSDKNRLTAMPSGQPSRTGDMSQKRHLSMWAAIQKPCLL